MAPDEGSDTQLARLANMDEVQEPVQKEELRLMEEQELVQQQPIEDDPGEDHPSPDYSDAEDPDAKEPAPNYDPTPPPDESGIEVP